MEMSELVDQKKLREYLTDCVERLEKILKQVEEIDEATLSDDQYLILACRAKIIGLQLLLMETGIPSKEGGCCLFNAGDVSKKLGSLRSSSTS